MSHVVDIKAKIWANRWTNQSHFGSEFIGTIKSLDSTGFSGTEENGGDFHCFKQFWCYEALSKESTKSDLENCMILESKLPEIQKIEETEEQMRELAEKQEQLANQLAKLKSC